jgi:hypothetical protein
MIRAHLSMGSSWFWAVPFWHSIHGGRKTEDMTASSLRAREASAGNAPAYSSRQCADCCFWGQLRLLRVMRIAALVLCLQAAALSFAQAENGAAYSLEPSLDYVTFAAFVPRQAQNPQDQAKPPANNPAAPAIGDLGFPDSQTQGNIAAQARLDKRSHMLKIHQRLGLIDTVPLIATVILGAGAGGKGTSTSDRWAHLALGSVTGDLYFISAYYAIRAPRIPGTQTRGQIRLHKALAWIHGPGMILTPILGAMAFDEKSNGEKVHGIASAHGAVAIVTAGAYGLAIASVSFKF